MFKERYTGLYKRYTSTSSKAELWESKLFREEKKLYEELISREHLKISNLITQGFYHDVFGKKYGLVPQNQCQEALACQVTGQKLCSEKHSNCNAIQNIGTNEDRVDGNSV